MSENSIVPVLLAGGIGSRLWPLSREHYPKQLLSLLGGYSFLQATLRRILMIKNLSQFVVICNEEHRFEILTQILELKPDCKFTILLEPVGRNTAPAAALAAFYLPEDANLLFLPADHVLKSDNAFIEQVLQAQGYANEGQLLTFGVKPSYPEIGYGYIRAGEPVDPDAYKILQFTEKPDKETAQQFLDSGDYYWNSGMFLFARNTLLEELQQYSPRIFSTIEKASQTFSQDNCFVRVDAALFFQAPDVSIDYAVMEHTQKALMFKLATQWSDIGSWQALYTYEEKNKENTVVNGDVISIDNKNCYFYTDSHLIAAVGLENIIVVQTADCVLITPLQESQRVKEIVNQLKSSGREEALQHLKQYHPWGESLIINREEDFIIRRIDILPGEATSYHSHQNSSESWMVVKGDADVMVNDSVSHYQAGDSFSIHANERHRITNTGTDNLSLVEVRVGSDFSRKDITRYDD